MIVSVVWNSRRGESDWIICRFSFHTRENRGFSIVKSTQNKVFWFAILEVLGVVSMAVYASLLLLHRICADCTPSVFKSTSYKPSSPRPGGGTRCSCQEIHLFPSHLMDFQHMYYCSLHGIDIPLHYSFTYLLGIHGPNTWFISIALTLKFDKK